MKKKKKKNVSGLRLTIHQMSLTEIDFVKYVVLFCKFENKLIIIML